MNEMSSLGLILPPQADEGEKDIQEIPKAFIKVDGAGGNAGLS
jgi:hypothetical protein